MTGVILEAMAAKSMYTVTPAYYDVALTYKYMRDADSAEMLDIILQSRIYDLAKIYNFGGVCASIAKIISTGEGNFASTWKRSEKLFEKNVEHAVEQFAKLKER